MTILTTERLILRPWIPADRAPFAALNADPEVRRHFAATQTRAESDASIDRFTEHWTRDGYGFDVAERRSDGAFLGMVGLQSVTLPSGTAVEIGWRLARAHWHQGYATEAARAWRDHGFATLGLAEIIAITLPGNAASRAVMHRLGMRRDPARDFDHSDLPPDNARIITYALANPDTDPDPRF